MKTNNRLERFLKKNWKELIVLAVGSFITGVFLKLLFIAIWK